MGACMNTSRIVQANAAIQLFVNRILLNLEDNIPPNAIGTKQWEWMKNYRVWEANRKVFLYPENWLEPEWRNNRSELFKDLESHLLQNDITERSVEQGLRNYLMSMNEVANLDVCGMHQENDEDGKLKFLHVFGRTHNLPYKYFYRRWNEYQKWSAWEKVSVDIRGVEDGENSGVHLIPVVWKGRLFLFWPEFMEKAIEDGNKADNMHARANIPIGQQEPKKYWEIRLAWSEYVDGAWDSKQVSKEFIQLLEGKNIGVIVSPFNVRITPRLSEDDSKLMFIVDATDQNFRSYFIIKNIHSQIVQGECPSFEHSTQSENLYTKSNYEKKQLQSIDSSETYLKIEKNYQILNENTLLSQSPFFYSESNSSYFVTQAKRFTRDDYFDKPVVDVDRLFKDFTASDNTPPVNSFMMAINKKTADWHSGGSIIVLPPNPNPNPDPTGDSDEKLCSVRINNNHLYKGSSLIFHTFHHPFSSKFLTRLNKGGIASLMGSDTEDINSENLTSISDVIKSDNGSTFNDNYNPAFDRGFVKPHINDLGERTYYQENICFDPFGANSLYNWELFFHAPLYIATRLSKNGKYKEAMQWFHYIFDPTTNEKATSEEDTARYWKVKPLKAESAKIETLEQWFKKLEPNPANLEETGNIDIDEWRNNPFDPHLVASNRPVAYMKHVVIKYIENLMAWGDSLFRQFTRESVYEAIQLYVIASHVLGKKPEEVPKRGKIKTESYANLRNKLDDFGNALVELENIFPYSGSVNNSPLSSGTNLLGIGEALYFCIPANDKLLAYWDTVTDRLFKIRHCQDIDGVERSLALFSPPIDPAALIQARSQGLSLGSVLADLSSPPPLYRFNYLLQKANEFCGDVRGLGSALLSAIEKKDAEELGRLRASQEINLLDQVTAIRERQVLAARSNKDNLFKLRETSKLRLQHYKDLLGDDSGEPADAESLDATLSVNSRLPADTNIPLVKTEVDMSLVSSDESGVKLVHREKQQLSKLEWSRYLTTGINANESLASIFHLFPSYDIYTAPLGTGVKTKPPQPSKFALAAQAVL
jgi:hypothetical protein